ncbi:MAG: type II toxin-antitoxin system RelE/ParE family toxin [Candidatus Micrarchaeota archaeon]|nr:type II toxin-antitoxin system RelE/ParE family toxin [Candidatus Micrarchaeota archaeon]
MESPYNIKLRDHVDKLFAKMAKRETRNLERIYSKLEEICIDPKRFKPLVAPMQGLRRVHVLGSFVLTYSIDEPSHTVWIEDFAHHDEIY